jgi:hypothetical protein
VLAESIFSCLAALRVFIRSRGDTALEILTLRQQLMVLKRKHPRPKLERLDRIFWLPFAAVGLVGPRPSSSSSPKRLSVGIAPDSAFTGVGVPGPAGAGLRSPKRFAI